MAERWEFEEAIECFKIIESSLRCIYSLEHHMYRVLAAQLRILLCDNTSKPLLSRLFRNLELQRLVAPVSYAPGTFPESHAHLNSVKIQASYPVLLTCMPFEVDVYANGVEDCTPILLQPAELLPLDQWVEQLITLHPVPVTIRQVIRTVADRGGGAHVHKARDALLQSLREVGPCKMPQAALAVVALSKVMQSVGHSVVQLYEKYGEKSSLPIEKFDQNHPFVVSAARIPEECRRATRHSFNLLLLSRADS